MDTSSPSPEGPQHEEKPSPVDQSVDRAVKSVEQNYVVVGKTHIRTWQGILVLGIVAGIAAGVLLVANRSGEVNPSSAAENAEESLRIAPAPGFTITDVEGAKVARGKSQDVLRIAAGLPSNSGIARTKALGELTTAVRERRKTIEELVTRDPAAAYLSMFPKSISSKLPLEVRGDIEQPVVLTAKIEVKHTDDFKKKSGSFQYVLHQNGKRLVFRPVGGNPEVLSASTVRVEGYQLGNMVVAPAFGGSFEVTAAATPDSVGDQRTLGILLRFQDSSEPLPLTKKQAQKAMFDGQVQAFFKEASSGNVKWTGDVVGWYTVPRSGDCSHPWPDFGGDSEYDEVYRLIRKDVDISQYDRIVLLVHGPCAGGGWSTVGKFNLLFEGRERSVSLSAVGSLITTLDGGPFPWSYFDYVLSHELGHSLGVVHANSWDCGTATLYGSCTHNEYGNQFDVMGFGNNALHFNAAFKEAFGWLKDSLLTITKSGTYTLKPLEAESGMRAAKLQPANQPEGALYVEYRVGKGFDARLAEKTSGAKQGLMMNWDAGEWWPATRLLDLAPTANNLDSWLDWADVVLPIGKPFKDPGRGITVTQKSVASSDAVSFSVGFSPPTCVRSDPFMTPTFIYIPDAQPGYQTYFYYSIQNMDSFRCKPSAFSEEFKAPVGWSVTPSQVLPKTLAPNEAYWQYGLISVPADAAVGEHTILAKVKNVATGKTATQTVTVSVKMPSVKVLQPNGGEEWGVGQTHDIKWEGTSFPQDAYVGITLVGEDGAEMTLFSDWNDPSTKNDGMESWTISDKIPAGQYRIRVWCGDKSTAGKCASGAADESDALFTIIGTPPPPPPSKCIVVSDTSTLVEGGTNAVPAYYKNPAWTAAIPGATWIWSSKLVEKPGENETRVFTKSITARGVTKATLMIAADTNYRVFLNGVKRFVDKSGNNYTTATQDTYDLTPYFVDGANTLRIEVTNIGIPGATAKANPAGLLYRIVVKSPSCGITPDPTPKPPPPQPVPTLSVSVAPAPPEQTVARGTKGFSFAKIVFDAANSEEDIRVVSAAVQLNGERAQDMTNCQLWDGPLALNTGPNIVNPSSIGDKVFTLDQQLFISAFKAKAISLKCDVASSGTGKWAQWILNGDETISATGANSGVSARVDVEPSGSGSVVNFISGGSLTVALDAATPGPRLLRAGMTDQAMTALRFTATNEAIDLKQIGLTVGSPQLAANFVKLTLWDGATKVGEGVVTARPEVTIETKGVLIPRDTDKILIVKADLANIGIAELGTPGVFLSADWVGGDPASSTFGVGETSAKNIYAVGANAPGNPGILVRAYPTLAALALPSTTFADGSQRSLYRFSLSAPAGTNGVSLYKMTFNVATSGDDGPSLDFSITHMKLYAYTSSNFSGDAYAANPLNQGPLFGSADSVVDGAEDDRASSQEYALYFNPSNPGVTTFGNAEVIAIPPGTTRYFELRGDVVGVDSGDLAAVQLLGDDASVGIGSGIAIDAYGTSARDDMIWSGNSTTTSMVGSPDWMNGYLIPGLPSGGTLATTLIAAAPRTSFFAAIGHGFLQLLGIE